MHNSQLHVLVIGGGSCGLALAQGLQKNNISYTLYERDSAADYHHRPRDWGSLLHWSQQYLEKCLPDHLWQRRQEMYVDSGYDYTQMPNPILVNSETGEIIKKVDSPQTARVSRAKVRKLLCQGLNIEYGKRLQSITTSDDGKTVAATFEDGTSATGDLLIGCDGGKSVARRYIVGDTAAKGYDTDFTMINHKSGFPQNPEVALALRNQHPIIGTCYSPRGGLGALIATLDIPYDEAGKQSGPEDWMFQIHTSWKGFPRKADFEGDQAKIRAFFMQRFSNLCEPFRSAGIRVDPDVPLPLDSGYNFSPVGDFDWDNHHGRVTLAGDSAHSMLPHRGQGLNNALMDASELVDAVKKIVDGKATLGKAIGDYEAEMRPRCAEEVQMTLAQAEASAPVADNEAGDFAGLKNGPLFSMGFHRKQDHS